MQTLIRTYAYPTAPCVSHNAGMTSVVETRNENRRITMVVEIGPETRQVLAGIEAALKRIADHFDPQPPEVVGTPYLADRLDCTATWIAQMVRDGEIPGSCIVPGSGKGRQWKFYRSRVRGMAGEQMKGRLDRRL